VGTRDFSGRTRGALAVIVDNGTVLNFSTFRKRRKRNKDRMVLKKRERTSTKRR
jgi:hypothetical protein